MPTFLIKLPVMTSNTDLFSPPRSDDLRTAADAIARDVQMLQRQLDQTRKVEKLLICTHSQKELMTPLEKSIEIALRAHAGQTDKSGAPYVLHPLRMMIRMGNEMEMMAAVLHDVVEDGGPEWSFERLEQEGIPHAVIDAVEYLTKRTDEASDYERFIRRAAAHPVARRVKLADLEDNMDLRRIEDLTEKDFVRLKKYREAYALLQALGE
jgi:(p)ppGpp synthase/HD superfamily hydrolase